MSILKIARMGHPALRAKARALERAEIRKPAVQRLIDDMIDTMDEYRGVGLAGPQAHVGLRLCIAVLNADATDEKEREPVVIVNPEITTVGTDLVDGWEGCLSIPD